MENRDDLQQYMAELWSFAVDKALDNHAADHKKYYNFTTPDLFYQEKGNSRYAVKGNLVCELKIFPWFVLPSNSSDSRYRETIYLKKGESIDTVTNAINYFKSLDLNKDDIVRLKNYYLENGAPVRPLWSIVTLRSWFEVERSLSLCKGAVIVFNSNIIIESKDALSARLAQMEEIITYLLTSKGISMTLPPHGSGLSMKQRIEFLERIVDQLLLHSDNEL